MMFETLPAFLRCAVLLLYCAVLCCIVPLLCCIVLYCAGSHCAFNIMIGLLSD
jgi:hypothetical protein